MNPPRVTIRSQDVDFRDNALPGEDATVIRGLHRPTGVSHTAVHSSLGTVKDQRLVQETLEAYVITGIEDTLTRIALWLVTRE